MSAGWLEGPPPDEPPTTLDGPGPVSSDPVCEVCGKPAELTPTGRVPKHPLCAEHKAGKSTRTTGGTRGSVGDRELNQACETLASLYDTLVLPFTMVGAGAEWAGQIDGLNERNRVILANNRDLVKRINRAGERGGNLAFLLSHVVAVSPAVAVLAGRARAARAARAEYVETEPEYVDVADAAFAGQQAGVAPGFWDNENAG